MKELLKQIVSDLNKDAEEKINILESNGATIEANRLRKELTRHKQMSKEFLNHIK